MNRAGIGPLQDAEGHLEPSNKKKWKKTIGEDTFLAAKVSFFRRSEKHIITQQY